MDSLGLFFDVNITMLDIWDNRIFHTMKSFFSTLYLSPFYNKYLNTHANIMLKKILSVSSFKELYSKLKLKYIINKTGSLDDFPDNKFNLVFSMNVLELLITPERVTGAVIHIVEIVTQIDIV